MKVSKKLANKVLYRAAELLDRGWCQGTYAKDAKGKDCDYELKKAKSFCLSGAINRATMELCTKKNERYLVQEAVNDLVRETLGEWPVNFNDADGRTQEEVVDAVLLVRTVNG